ncbi:hypothetical protein M8C21_025420, partial [Ambrosia artemisiifolia]
VLLIKYDWIFRSSLKLVRHRESSIENVAKSASYCSNVLPVSFPRHSGHNQAFDAPDHLPKNCCTNLKPGFISYEHGLSSYSINITFSWNECGRQRIVGSWFTG